MSINKLALGTVQFGIDYGVSNNQGQTSVEQAHQILALAYNNGVRILDTASGYGNAEQVIGNYQQHRFQVVTKTPAFNHDVICSSDITLLKRAFEQSQQQLAHHQIKALMVHHGENLLKTNADLLFTELEKLKHQQQVNQIGISIYNLKQLETITDRYSIDIVQLPFNLLDQQALNSGLLAKLKQKGIEVHVRSVFLQGLLLMPLAELPDYFKPIKALLELFQQYCIQHDVTPLNLAYRFAEQCPFIDHIVCGFNQSSQLSQLLQLSDFHVNYTELTKFSLNDEVFICPANWQINN